MSLTDSTIDYLGSLLIMASNYSEAEKPPNLIIISKNLHVSYSLMYIIASGDEQNVEIKKETELQFLTAATHSLMIIMQQRTSL